MSAKSKERKYIVATLDPDLRSALNSLPGIPLLYLNKVIVVMEPPSQKSKEYNNQVDGLLLFP